jgi:aromatic-amino-acid transaminase
MSALVPASRDRVGNDPIFALNAEARRRAAAGESIVNATMGALMDDAGRLAVMPSVVEAFGRVPPSRWSGYGPIAGDPEFLQAATADLLGGGPLHDQAVSCATPGGTGAVYEAVVNFLEPGQKLLTTSYFWGPYADIARHASRGMDTFRMYTPELGFDVGALAEGVERHIRDQGRALVILNFPSHNPTGYSLSPEEWERVADVLCDAGERAPVAVLLDCAYLKFGGAAIGRWSEALPRLLESTTVLFAWTASKAFTQYGSRVGALIACHRQPGERTQLANALSYSSRATWSNCNHLGLLAITDLLTDSELRSHADAERQELIDLLQGRTEVFNQAAAAAGLEMPRYESGFFTAVFTPDPQATAASMREAGVFVIPIPGAVRVALCSTPAAAVPRLVDALAQGVGVAAAGVSG